MFGKTGCRLSLLVDADDVGDPAEGVLVVLAQAVGFVGFAEFLLCV